MSGLAALVWTTSVWGLALQPPSMPVALTLAPIAQLEETTELSLDAEALRAEQHDATMREWTRTMSAVTVAVFAVAGTLGALQFHDEYGFHDDYADTACARGDALLDHCGEQTPWAHLIAVGATAGLGLTTFVLSTQVDYDIASRHDEDWRIYEVTRWVGLGMFVVQAIGGFLIANAERFGWADPQDDFDTMQGLAIAHLGLGAATFGLEVFNTLILF
ncbi:hypothetical protein [Sandaracinus amylolyticus]|uniref:hypothetical protein n=1 Tax=Sandaracinus amylolyticus TaxID=927083 RepID=UPI001F31B47A|nr:hypothetical protein [Sandaracinus amylolyticus]UJR83269.1 Hypothetical protein I5071_53360 [Sandaracinus amylolyticus]